MHVPRGGSKAACSAARLQSASHSSRTCAFLHHAPLAPPCKPARPLTGRRAPAAPSGTCTASAYAVTWMVPADPVPPPAARGCCAAAAPAAAAPPPVDVPADGWDSVCVGELPLPPPPRGGEPAPRRGEVAVEALGRRSLGELSPDFLICSSADRCSSQSDIALDRGREHVGGRVSVCLERDCQARQRCTWRGLPGKPIKLAATACAGKMRRTAGGPSQRTEHCTHVLCMLGHAGLLLTRHAGWWECPGWRRGRTNPRHPSG